jgi:hypothetical protein
MPLYTPAVLLKSFNLMVAARNFCQLALTLPGSNDGFCTLDF